MAKTQYIKYRRAEVTLAKDNKVLVTYPNNNIIIGLVRVMVEKKQRELKSYGKKYRVTYGRNSMGEVFTDIDNVMNHYEEYLKSVKNK